MGSWSGQGREQVWADCPVLGRDVTESNEGFSNGRGLLNTNHSIKSSYSLVMTLELETR